MLYKFIYEITPQLHKKLQIIANICNEHDMINHSFFIEDDTDFLNGHPALCICIDINDNIIGFISLFGIDDNVYEACSFVIPEHRQNHIFTNLLSNIKSNMDSAILSFPISLKNSNAVNILTHFGGRLCNSEYLMSISLNNYCIRETNFTIKQIYSEKNLVQYEAYIDTCNVGSGILSITNSVGTLSEINIKKEYRSSGLGTPLINSLLNKLYNSKCEKAILHVSSDNIPACKLYKSAGFVIESQVDYYNIF